MRQYEITITDSTGAPKIIQSPGGTGGPIFNGKWTSVYSGTTNANAFGTVTNTALFTNPGALNIEFEIQNAVLNMPEVGSFVRVYGVGLPLLAQAANFNPQFTTNASNTSVDSTMIANTLTIKGGMAKGLPLANPNQYGILTAGSIYQAFGNWQGTEQTIDFMILPQWGNNNQPYNFVFKCNAGQPLAPSIISSIETAMKLTPTVSISSSLVAPFDISFDANSFPQFATKLNEISTGIIKTAGYAGIQTRYSQAGVFVDDYTSPAPEAKPLSFTDFIGQPTWIGPQFLTFKTVLRADISVGDVVTMPQQFQQKGLILTTPQSLSQFKQTVDFQGNFRIQSVRHLGIYRQGDANSWVTIFQAFKTL